MRSKILTKYIPTDSYQKNKPALFQFRQRVEFCCEQAAGFLLRWMTIYAGVCGSVLSCSSKPPDG